MATIPQKRVGDIKKLYTAERLSAQDIANKFNYPLNAVYYILRKHKIERRSPRENSKILFENKPLSFKLKENLDESEQKLLTAGVMLYWAEGYKTEKSPGIDFANSDVDMQKLFIAFLRKICGIDESRLKILLYTHSKNKQAAQMRYWSKHLSIPLKQFTSPYISPLGKLEKKDKMPYGLIHVRYYDKKLLKQIMTWIEQEKKI